jgi:hypothetical protein
MEAVLYIVGALWIVVGTLTVLYTDTARRWSLRFTHAIPVKLLAVFPIVLGGLLMLSAAWSHSFWLVEAVGILAVMKGALFLLLRQDRAAAVLAWWQERASDVTWRFGGLILVILGVFLVLRL